MADAFAVQRPIVAEPPRPWRSWRGGIAAFPIDGASEIDKKAAQLWEEVSQRLAHVDAVEQNRRDAEQAVEVAQRAYDAEVQRAGAAGEVSGTDTALLAKRDACVGAARPELHTERLRVAVELHQQAERDYIRFVDQHALEFVAELRQDAENVAAAWRSVTEEFNERLAPIVREHDRLRNAVQFVIGNTPPFADEDVPRACAEPPFPTPDAFARYEALHNPEPEPAEDETADGRGVTWAGPV